jgi:hypothetical protein
MTARVVKSKASGQKIPKFANFGQLLCDFGYLRSRSIVALRLDNQENSNDKTPTLLQLLESYRYLQSRSHLKQVP